MTSQNGDTDFSLKEVKRRVAQAANIDPDTIKLLADGKNTILKIDSPPSGTILGLISQRLHDCDIMNIPHPVNSNAIILGGSMQLIASKLPGGQSLAAS